MSLQISDYVKNGKTKAHIEIELASGDGNQTTVFHRSFDKNSKETFSIDGTAVNYKEYLSRIKNFNIQVDNLCMFLPQDRVQDFTKLNSQELLHNTQISVCTPEINEAFQKLLKTRELQKNNTKANADLQTRLEDNRNRNEQLRGQIENNNLKDKLIGKVEILAKKKAWKEYEDLMAMHKAHEDDMKSADKMMKKAMDELKPLVDKQKNIAGTKNSIKNSISKATTAIVASTEEVERLCDASQKLESDVNRAKQNMRNIIDTVQNHKKEVGELQLLVDLEKNEVENAKKALVNEGDIEGKMQQCDAEILEMKSEVERLMHQRQVVINSLDETIMPSLVNCQRKIASLGDTQRQRIDLLRNQEDPYTAYEWLKVNRENFQGRIFNPVMVEITVKEKKNAKYVENTIGMKDLMAFVCTDKDDMKKLIQKLRGDMKLQVNVAFAEDTNQIEYESPQDIQAFSPNLGLQSYLIDMIDGPAPIINYLCKLYHIQNVAVGDDRTFENASRLPNNFKVFFSTNHRFHVTVSKYSGAKSTSSSMIQDRNILNVGIDKRMKEREEVNLEKWKNEANKKKTIKTQLEGEITNCEHQITDIRAAKKQIQQKIDKVRICAEKLRKKQAELENLINRKIDVDEERKKFKNGVDGLIMRLIKVNEKQVAALREYKKNRVHRILGNKKLDVFEKSTGNVDEAIRLQQREIDGKRDLYDKVRRNYEGIKNRLKTKEKDALELTEGISPSDRKFKYTSKFAKLPDTVAELQNQIEEHQGRIDCIRGVDPRIIAEYEERSKEIKDLEDQLGNEKNRMEKLETDLKGLHEVWYPAIQNIVQTINTNFSEFFNKMGFVGEVEMTRKEEVCFEQFFIVFNLCDCRIFFREITQITAFKFEFSIVTMKSCKH
jgi:structural maintenance of chromosomes protein 5